MSPVTGGAMPSWPGNFKSSTDTLSTSISSDFGYKAYIPRVITTPSQNSSTVPSYAGSWDGSTVHDSGDETDAMFYEQPLDATIGTRAKQNYINAYWRSFHPAFPILHKLTYQRKMPSPLLQAAIMAVGTHYSAEPHADGDAKVMQEKCNRLLANVSVDRQRSHASSANLIVDRNSFYGRHASNIPHRDVFSIQGQTVTKVAVRSLHRDV